MPNPVVEALKQIIEKCRDSGYGPAWESLRLASAALPVAERQAQQGEYISILQAQITERNQELSELRKDRERLEILVNRMLDDFASLERSYGPSLWTTGAGYTLQPRVLELRAAMESKP